MKISIITISFNNENSILNTINSVLYQHYNDIEYIIIDGNSKDKTLDIIKSFGNRITKVISEPDKGIYDALNKGIQNSSGEIIGFLHSDDQFASISTLDEIVKKFNTPESGRNRFPDVVYGDLVFIDQKDSNKVVRFWKSRPFRSVLLKRGWMPPHPTIFMRQEVYKKHGTFKMDLKCAADYDYIIRVFSDTSLIISYLPIVITKMRIGGVSTMGIKNLINKSKEDYLILKRNHMQFPLWVLFSKNISKMPQLIFRKHKINCNEHNLTI